MRRLQARLGKPVSKFGLGLMVSPDPTDVLSVTGCIPARMPPALGLTAQAPGLGAAGPSPCRSSCPRVRPSTTASSSGASPAPTPSCDPASTSRSPCCQRAHRRCATTTSPRSTMSPPSSSSGLRRPPAVTSNVSAVRVCARPVTTAALPYLFARSRTSKACSSPPDISPRHLARTGLRRIAADAVLGRAPVPEPSASTACTPSRPCESDVGRRSSVRAVSVLGCESPLMQAPLGRVLRRDSPARYRGPGGWGMLVRPDRAARASVSRSARSRASQIVRSA